MSVNFRNLVLIILFLFGIEHVNAQVKISSLISNNMVLQQQTEASIWGWANPNDTVKVMGSWDNVEFSSIADDSSRWEVKLNTPTAGGPYYITVNGDTINNVLIGEVWVCSGQSNMEWTVAKSVNAAEEIANANYPEIRLFQVPNTLAQFPQDSVNAEWKICQPGIINNFSAVGYFFGRELHTEMNIPIGLIGSEWGGTIIETWTPAEALETSPDLTPPLNKNDASVLYNGMIHPLIPFSIQGAIWYQGESNYMRGDRLNYTEKMDSMITSWRRNWGVGELSFFYVQLSPFNYYGRDLELPIFWEAQTAALSIPNTGMAVITDVGYYGDIHPKNKQDVGKRLALWALAKTYGQDEIVFSGPMFKSASFEGNSARIQFDHLGSGLAGRDTSKIFGFEVAAAHVPYQQADAIINGNEILLSNPLVDTIQAVRYAWRPPFTCNLINNEGLPAVPFRTGYEYFTPLSYPAKNSDEFEFKYEANSSTPDEENAEEGWNKYENAEGDSFSVSNGVLSYSTTQTTGGRYFFQRDAEDAWVSKISDTTSFTIEIRVKVTASDGKCPGIIIWAATGSKTAFMSIGTTGVYWNGYLTTGGAEKDTLIEGIDNENEFHKYRITYNKLWDKFKVWRDEVVIGDSLTQLNIIYKPWLLFGDFDAKTAGTVEIDYFRWDLSDAYSPGTSTSVNKEKNITINDFQLYQNYPNPFNPSTTIKYRIADTGDLHSTSQQVVLKIYDILGREITTLVNQKQKSGAYEVKFDASGLSSGIYFYSLKSGGFSKNKKLMYLK